jgi:hypothetical protein
MVFDQELLTRVNDISTSNDESVYGSFCNEWGSLRLRKVQYFYGYDRKEKLQSRPLTDVDLNEITDLYVRWRDTDEVVPIKYVYEDSTIEDWGDKADSYVSFVYKQTGKLLYNYKGYVTVPRERYEWRFPTAIKRGNDEYIRLIEERLKPFLNNEPIKFFEDDWGLKKTNALYLTGTVEHSLCGNDRGYLEFGSWWNSFITNIRLQMGDLVFIRTWQSQKNGYPHFHAILYFKDREFTAVKWRDEDGGISYRLWSRSEDRKILKNAWKWGHLDIQCVQDMTESFKDLLKYVTRCLEGGESDLTNALLWYFQRQAFGISDDFVNVVWGKENVTLSEPDSVDLIDRNMSNSKSGLIRIEIYPTVRRDLFSFSSQNRIDTNEDPPPFTENDARLLNYLTRDCDLVECKRSEKLDVPVFMYRSSSSGSSGSSYSSMKDKPCRCDKCGVLKTWGDLRTINGVHICYECYPKEKGGY